jgi:hypothetical protein
MKKEAVTFPESLIVSYYTGGRRIPEDSNFQVPVVHSEITPNYFVADNINTFR